MVHTVHMAVETHPHLSPSPASLIRSPLPSSSWDLKRLPLEQKSRVTFLCFQCLWWPPGNRTKHSEISHDITCTQWLQQQNLYATYVSSDGGHKLLTSTWATQVDKLKHIWSLLLFSGSKVVMTWWTELYIYFICSNDLLYGIALRIPSTVFGWSGSSSH